MRQYYIYKSEPIVKIIYKKSKYGYEFFDHYLCAYGPYEYLGYVVGIKELFNNLGKYPLISQSFNYPLSDNKFKYLFYPKNYYIIVDDLGRIRDYADLIKGIYKKDNSRFNHPYQFRKDPVPRTGIGSRARILRHPHTSQELKNLFTDKEIKELHDIYPDTIIHVRREKRKNIPTLYDDLPCSDYRQKCWKDCTKRKRQYKKIKNYS